MKKGWRRCRPLRVQARPPPTQAEVNRSAGEPAGARTAYPTVARACYLPTPSPVTCQSGGRRELKGTSGHSLHFHARCHSDAQERYHEGAGSSVPELLRQPVMSAAVVVIDL
jgi:hypothetical protein